jgi:hypothetical protein
VGNDDHRSAPTETTGERAANGALGPWQQRNISVARHSESRAEIGDEAIGAIVHAERSRIAKGDGVSFRETRHFLEHLRKTAPSVGVSWSVFATDSSQPDFDSLEANK